MHNLKPIPKQTANVIFLFPQDGAGLLHFPRVCGRTIHYKKAVRTTSCVNWLSRIICRCLTLSKNNNQCVDINFILEKSDRLLAQESKQLLKINFIQLVSHIHIYPVSHVFHNSRAEQSAREMQIKPKIKNNHNFDLRFK